jgi:hypothetical protein
MFDSEIAMTAEKFACARGHGGRCVRLCRSVSAARTAGGRASTAEDASAGEDDALASDVAPVAGAPIAGGAGRDPCGGPLADAGAIAGAGDASSGDLTPVAGESMTPSQAN